MSQRYAYFYPASQTIGLYRESGIGFRRSFVISVPDMEQGQQMTIASSLAWLQSQLETGETLSQVIFEPYVKEGDIGLIGAITGRSATGGERTIKIDSKDVPEEVADGLVKLWNELSSIHIPTAIT